VTPKRTNHLSNLDAKLLFTSLQVLAFS